MANKEILDNFKDVLHRWTEFDYSKSIRMELGAESFGQLKPIVEHVNYMLKMTDLVKEELSNDVVSNMGEYAMHIMTECISLQKVSASDFISRKGLVLIEIEQWLDGMRQLWPSVLALVNAGSDTIGAQRSVLEELEKKAQHVDRLIRDLDVKAATFTKATEAISSSSIIKEEEVFSKDAGRFRISSWIWLVLIVLFSGVFLLALKWIIKDFCFEMNCYQQVSALDYNKACIDCNRPVLYLEMAKAVSFRLLLISFLLFLVGMCVKNYNAAMHNYTINTHKANSLAAARTMLGLNLSQQGHDQLMTMAASAIFSHQSTGYNNRPPENPGLGQILGALSSVKSTEAGK